MSLTIETGLIVEGADSFISVADARVVATKFGMTLPADDTTLEVHLRNAYNYIQLYERKLSGSRVSALQTGPFPRMNCYDVYGFMLDSETIPANAKHAQVAIAEEMGKGTDVRPTNEYSGIQSERLEGVVSTTYSSNAKYGAVVAITKAIDFLRPYIVASSAVIRG